MFMFGLYDNDEIWEVEAVGMEIGVDTFIYKRVI